MKATTLQKRIDENLTTAQGSYKKRYHEVIRFLANGGKARPCKAHGSGRYITNIDHSANYIEVLKTLNLDFTCGNDAPRGGQCGKFIALTSRGKQQVKEWQQSEFCIKTIHKLK